jgi:hypothetical protein
MTKYSTESWKEKAILKYGTERFNFENSVYIDSYNKIKVFCNLQNKELLVDAINFIKETTDINDFVVSTKEPKLEIENNYFDKVNLIYKYSVTDLLNKIKFIYLDKKENISNEFFNFELLEKYEKDCKLFISEFRQNNRIFYLPDCPDYLIQMNCFYLEEVVQLEHNQIKYIRDSLLVKQNNICLLCENEIKAPTLDHYHTKIQHGSGLIRGVICNTCNRMVGVIENNIARNNLSFSDMPKFLVNLSDYLKTQREPFIHPTEKDKKPKLMKSSYNKLLKVIDNNQKVPAFQDKNGNFTAPLKKLFQKYNIIPEFKK